MDLSFVNTLFFSLFLTPILLGVLGVSLKPGARNRLFFVEFALLLSGSVGLGLLGERRFDTLIIFMDAPISFSISTTGVMLFSGLLLSLGVLYWLELKKDQPLTTYAVVLLHLSLSFGFLALMSGQFMIRYIALDLVGLFVALSILQNFKNSQNLKKFISVFQILRLGDLSLLISILLINAFTRTLDISQMISAASEMPSPSRTWVFFGFIFAILIKLAIWPLGIWQRHAREAVTGVVFWMSGFLMPVLGLYLLYRVIPFIHGDPFFQTIILMMSLGLFTLIILAHWLKWVQLDRFLLVNGLLGCFALGAAAIPGSGFLGYYLVGLTLIRLLVSLDEARASAVTRFTFWLAALVINAAFLWVNAHIWPTTLMIAWGVLTGVMLFWLWEYIDQAREEGDQYRPLSQDRSPREAPAGDLLNRSAHWINQKLETDVLSNSFSAMTALFFGLASWLRENVEGGFEKGWSGVNQGLIWASEGTLAALEVKPAAKTDDLVDDALEGLAAYERNVLKKTLRWDLALIPLFLGIILALLFIF